MNNIFLTLFIAQIMATTNHPDVGKIINNHIKQMDAVALDLRVLRDKMTPFSQVAGPDFGSPGLFEYLSASGLLQTADDLARAVTAIREQTVILVDVMSASQKEKIQKLMAKVDEAEKELALVETPLRKKARAFENKAFHVTNPN